MSFKRSEDGNLIEIDNKVRVEAGPVRKRAVATEALLSDDVTSAHYKVGSPDALNKIIELGQPMDYIDWKSPARVFYVYQLDEVEKIKMIEGPMKDEIIEQPRWLLKGDYKTQDEAIVAAMTLAK